MDYENKFRPAGSFGASATPSAEEPVPSPISNEPDASAAGPMRFDPMTGAPIVPPTPAPAVTAEAVRR